MSRINLPAIINVIIGFILGARMHMADLSANQNATHQRRVVHRLQHLLCVCLHRLSAGRILLQWYNQRLPDFYQRNVYLYHGDNRFEGEQGQDS